MQRTTDLENLGKTSAAPNAPAVEPIDESLVDAALAELDAVRAHIDGLGWDDTDSTEILRRLREGADEE